MTQRVARLTWSYNTTNHPYLPTTGSLVSVTPLVTWRDDNTSFRDFPEPLILVPVHTRTIGIQTTALRYWDLTEQISVSGGVEAGWGISDERRTEPGGVRVFDDYTTMFGGVHAGVSRSLWSPEQRAAGGDSRVELNLRGRVRDSGRRDRRLFLEAEDDLLQASLSWVRHSSWGTFRLGAGYAW
jgi:outer membrane protein assembly factor BamA